MYSIIQNRCEKHNKILKESAKKVNSRFSMLDILNW